MMKKTLSTTLALLVSVSSLAMISGCARNITAGNYASAGVGEAMTSYEGVVVSKRQVVVQDQDKLQDNTLGMVAGGVAGGVLGSTIGHGDGNKLAMLGGAALGAAGGALAQQELSKQEAFEYTVKLTNGTLKTVVQGTDVNIAPGTRVILHIGDKARSRIVPIGA